jgi:hypothetical protein
MNSAIICDFIVGERKTTTKSLAGINKIRRRISWGYLITKVVLVVRYLNFFFFFALKIYTLKKTNGIYYKNMGI